MDKEKILTLTETAKRLRIPRGTLVQRLLRKSDSPKPLPRGRGQEYRFLETVVDQWIADHDYDQNSAAS